MVPRAMGQRMFTARGVLTLIAAIDERFRQEEARAKKGQKVTVQILQEWDSITKETGPKEDEFLSVEIRLDQALCL